MKRLLIIIALSTLMQKVAAHDMQNYDSHLFGTVREAHPIVKTTFGKVKGENRDGVAIFRGIPYGGNCDGENRFMPPITPKSWSHIKDCTVNGPIAMQDGAGSISGDITLGAYFSGGHPELFGVKDEKQSENCLVLDILTPGIDNAKRPVQALHWIHDNILNFGGAYYQAIAKASQKGAPVYNYVISFDTTLPQYQLKRMSWHTADLPLQMRIVLYKDNEPISKLMAHCWAAFARTDNPSTEQLKWPEFNVTTRHVMVFDKNSRVESDPLKTMRESLSE